MGDCNCFSTAWLAVGMLFIGIAVGGAAVALVLRNAFPRLPW